MPNPTAVRVKIPHASVKHDWQCPHCKNSTELSGPDYASVGTPHCADCECSMECTGTILIATVKVMTLVVQQTAKAEAAAKAAKEAEKCLNHSLTRRSTSKPKSS